MIPIIVTHHAARIPSERTVYACIPEDCSISDSMRLFSHDKEGIDDLIRSVRMARGDESVYVARVDLLHLSAQQALLKFLEEPPVDIPVMLTTDRIDSIPDTILSRCFIERKNIEVDVELPTHIRLDIKERLHDTPVSAYNIPGMDDYRIIGIDLEKEL